MPEPILLPSRLHGEGIRCFMRRKERLEQQTRQRQLDAAPPYHGGGDEKIDAMLVVRKRKMSLVYGCYDKQVCRKRSVKSCLGLKRIILTDVRGICIFKNSIP